MTKDRKNIVFFHPDLGIGGAERLIIDSALGLKNSGHNVVIFTSRCDHHHCFDEARDGTLDVRVRGNSIVPASIFSRFSIICAILRQLHLIISISLNAELTKLKPDIFFVDQLSAGLPWLAFLYPKTRILFYCHFPDLLLAQGRAAWWKRLYRVPFDFLETYSMEFADVILVNSNFTKKILGDVFPNLSKKEHIKVVYPCVNIRNSNHERDESLSAWCDIKLLLSINRFERKKNIGLAIRAYAGLEKHERHGSKLILAGGYDNYIKENVTYHKELVCLAESMGLKTASSKTIVTLFNVPQDVDVLFLLSITNGLKNMLLRSARLLIYTPSNEHFGIVPLEAMLFGVPVLATNTGGPLETVVDGRSGWLCQPEDVKHWTMVINNVLNNIPDENIRQMGAYGIERVNKEFSDTQMTEKLEKIVLGMTFTRTRSNRELPFLLSIILVIIGILFFALKNRILGN